jgi:hypothetical protein
VQEDNETLDVVKTGAWSQLSAAYRDLVPGPASPLGLQNMFGYPPYPFPTAVQVTGLDPVSDCLGWVD